MCIPNPSPQGIAASPYHRNLEPAPSGLPSNNPSQLYSVMGCTDPRPGNNAVFCDTADTAPGFTAWGMDQLGYYGLALSNYGCVASSEITTDL